MIFEKFGDLIAHLDVGDHTRGKLKIEFPLTRLETNGLRNSLLLTRQKKSASADSSAATASKSRGSRCDSNFHSGGRYRVLGEGKLDFLPK